MAHHRGERAPPPTARIGPNLRPMKRSTPWLSHRLLKATPSMTARTIWARVVRRDRLWKPARARRSSTGDRSPANQGVKRAHRFPVRLVRPTPSVPRSSGAGSPSARQSRSHSSAPPAAFWLLATRLRPGVTPTTVVICRNGSVFFLGYGQLIQLVVEMARWGW